MNWKHKVNFRDLLDEFNDSADELDEIKRVLPLWTARFKQINCLKHFVPNLKGIKTQSQFNKWLESVYDYCDYNAIWVNL